MGSFDSEAQPDKPPVSRYATSQQRIVDHYRHAPTPAGLSPRAPSPPVSSPVSLIGSFLLVQVVRRVVLAPDVVTLHLARPGTQHPPTLFLPGQYITLILPGHNDVHYRSYSLSNASSPSEPWEITIKRRPQGAISSYLFDDIREGMVFQVMPPRGAFTVPTPLDNRATLVFIAAGSGITPVRSMVRAIATLPAEQRPQVAIHQTGQVLDDLLFVTEWRQLDPAARWLTANHELAARGTIPTAATLVARYGNSARHHWYISGPEAFVVACYRELAQQDIPPERLHTEQRA